MMTTWSFSPRDSHVHTPEDLELKADERDIEERDLLQLRDELERGEMHTAMLKTKF